MLVRDRVEREREVARREAELQVASGSFANLADTVIEPTAEWMAKSDTVPFTPKQPDGTVRVVRSVRRVVTPIVIRMWRAGRVTDDQARACIWYRECFDVSGLVGSYSRSRTGENTTIHGSRKEGGFAGHIPLSGFEAEARRNYRAAKAALPERYVPFFEKVVLDDAPLRVAGRLARCRNDRVTQIFRQVSETLVSFCEAMGVDYDLKLDAR